MEDFKKENLVKEQIRGIIKQLMKVRRLRSISIANYNLWKNKPNNNSWLHSIKFDMMNGYIDAYTFSNKKGDKKAGACLTDLTNKQYLEMYDYVIGILNDEKNIPSKIKRNILVKVSR